MKLVFPDAPRGYMLIPTGFLKVLSTSWTLLYGVELLRTGKELDRRSKVG